MYIIHTLHGAVKCDYDEIEKISKATRGLVFLRNGAVNPAHITNIILDKERMDSVPKVYGETDEDRLEKIKNDKSPDIFRTIRGGMI